MKKTIVSLFASCLLMMQTTYAQLVTGENTGVTNTDAGKVRGYINNGVVTYKGIPYA